MNLFKKEQLILNSSSKTKEEVFKEISNLAKKLEITTDSNKLIEGFKHRESEGSTGFEDGFAIPHARIKEIVKPAVIVVKLAQGVEWESIDGKPTNIVISLLIPEKNENNMHLSILSSIAKKLTDSKNRDIIKNAKTFDEINEILFSSQITKKEVQPTSKKLLVGITACPVGVAHTYLAADKLTAMAIQMGYDIKIETHGSSGVENIITDEEVKKADRVIIAADIGVETDKFNGKRIYRADVSEAIKNPQKVIEDSESKAKVENSKETGEFTLDNNKGKSTGVIKHLMSGVSYMVPMVIVGGIFLALSIGLTKAIYGNEWLPGTPGNAPQNNETHTLAGYHFLSYLNGIGGLAFTLMVPILGAYIANSIGGRSAIVPAMLASYVANSPNLFFPIGGLSVQTPTGFLGAIGIGLGVGYLVKWINTKWKIPKNLKPVMPLFFMPIVVGGTFSLLFVYAIGAPIGWVMNQLENGIKNILSDGNLGRGIAFGMGFLIGAMSGFDLGGPINKIAFFTCSALLTDPTNPVSEPMGMMACAGAVPPLGMALCTFIFRKNFDEEEKQEGVAALIMGLIGISEGAIPFAIRNPKRAILSNVIGSGVAGALGGLMLVTDMAAHTGPIVVVLGAVPYGIQTLYAFIAIIVGMLITCFMNGFWTTFDNKRIKNKSKKELKLDKVLAVK